MINRDRRVPAKLILGIATFLIALMVFLSVGIYLNPSIPVLFLALFVLAVVCEYRKKYLPRIALTLASVVVLGIYVYRFRLTTDVAPITVEALLVLLAVKLLEKKQFRDYVQIYLISVFLLAGSALLGISLVFLCYATVLLFLFNAAMILVAYYREDPEISLSLGSLLSIVWKGSLIALCAIPLSALIFVVTPRTPLPVLDFLNQKNRVVTGFSDQVGLGKVSAIQEDGSPVFRASMDAVPQEMLYWRGIVLDYFDGSTWKSGHGSSNPERIPRRALRSAIWQDIYLEPYGNTYLFGLDRPILVAYRGTTEYADGTFSCNEAMGRKIRYRVASMVRPRDDPPGPRIDRNLQLPSNLSTSVTQLARQLRDQDSEATLNSILRFLNGKDFSYSLRNLPVTATPLDEFLFNVRHGNCEYFASAFSVLARANGIPARLVAGYQGGLYSDLGKYYLVTQKQAHVWVEAYIAGTGWVRYDPTPMAQGLLKRQTQSLLAQARLNLDMVNYLWVAFVVNYDVQKQFTLFSKTGSALGDIGIKVGRLPTRYVGIAAVILALLFVAAVWIRGRLRKSDAERLIEAFTRCLAKRGYTRPPSQGLEEFVATIRDDGLRNCTRKFVSRFEGIYYTDKDFSREETAALKANLREMAELDRTRRNDRQPGVP